MYAAFFLRPIDKVLYIIYVRLCTVLCAFIVHSIILSVALSALMSYKSTPTHAPIGIGMNTGCHVVHLIQRGMMRLDGASQRSRKPSAGWLFDMGLLERPVFWWKFWTWSIAHTTILSFLGVPCFVTPVALIHRGSSLGRSRQFQDLLRRNLTHCFRSLLWHLMVWREWTCLIQQKNHEWFGVELILRICNADSVQQIAQAAYFFWLA